MLCEHRCGVNRIRGERGPCRAGATPRLIRHRIEYGEESSLIPSHLFYLSGCDLRCVFCIAGLDAFDAKRGRELTSEVFNAAVTEGRARGARNIQWVGGEPTIHLPYLLRLMDACPELPEVVWKSDFFGTPQAFELLDGVADIYLADFKFGSDSCAKRLAGVSDYCRIVERNLKIASSQGRLIVRHLLLPGHERCCFRPIADWMRVNLPQVEFSLRDGYLPSFRADRFVELRSPLMASATTSARDYAVAQELNVIE